MMFHRPGSIKKNQRGFTLLEIMLAMVISGIIAVAIAGAVFMVVMGNASSKNHMIALKQVQSAGYWVSHDAQMAQTVVPTKDTDGFPLTLSWTDDKSDPVVTYTYTYTIVGSELKRQYGTMNTTIARFIYADATMTNCRLSGSGNFTLPDKNDAFTISGGTIADSGRIPVVKSGGISVTATLGATYDSGTGKWTTPAGGGTIIVTATAATTEGTWLSNMASATIAITTDADKDATITGDALVFKVTATVGTGSPRQTETRVYNVTPRPTPGPS